VADKEIEMLVEEIMRLSEEHEKLKAFWQWSNETQKVHFESYWERMKQRDEKTRQNQ